MKFKLAQPQINFSLLCKIDHEKALEFKDKACFFCGGKLHVANYPRKPRGTEESDPTSCKKYSFCCASCRRRNTPPSLRYIKGFNYISPFVLIIIDYMQAKERKTPILSFISEVSYRTLKRWMEFWEFEFAKTYLHVHLRSFFPDAILFPSYLFKLNKILIEILIFFGNSASEIDGPCSFRRVCSIDSPS